MSKQQQALNAFNTYLRQMTNINSRESGNAWKSKVLETIKLYFEGDSAFYKQLDDMSFTKPKDKFNLYDYAEEKKRGFELVVKEIIQFIELNGVRSEYSKLNFLSTFTTNQILWWGGGLAVGVFLAGIAFHVYFSESKMERIQNEADTKVNEANRVINELQKADMEKEKSCAKAQADADVYQVLYTEYRQMDSLCKLSKK